MKKIITATILFPLHFLAFAEVKTVTAQLEMQKIISQIPVTDKGFGYKNVGERMQNLGMKIESVRVDSVRREDADPPMYKAGDQVIKIGTSEPSAVIKSICAITGGPEYIKRGKKYIPNGRTAYWLMHNKCETSQR